MFGPSEGRGRWAAEPVSVCVSVCACVYLVFLNVQVLCTTCVCVFIAVVQRDGKERSLKDSSTCQHGYCCTVMAISIQLLSLTLRAKPQKPSSHPQKKAFILLLKVQYIDELIDNLSKISKGQPRQQRLWFLYLFSLFLSHSFTLQILPLR